MVVKITDFGKEQQIKILKRYNKYYKNDLLIWEVPPHEMKNLIGECWDLSRILNKHRKLDMGDVLNNIKHKTLEDVKEKYNQLSQEDFYKYIIGKLEERKD